MYFLLDNFKKICYTNGMFTEKLNNLAEIKSGYTFRERVVSVENGDVFVIQPKDLSDFSYSKMARINLFKNMRKHLLEKGDVLLSNRGNFWAITYDGKYPAIGSGGFFIIQVNNNRILPEYLSLFLNSDLAQRTFLRLQESMTIPALTRTQIADIEIPIPSIKNQQKLIEFERLQKKEYNLIESLLSLKKQRLNAIIKGVINE